MAITESRPNELILIDLEFLKPFAARNIAEFTFKPQGDQTLVTWTMSGKNKFIAKIFCSFMNMDKMIGKEFEKGLASMKASSAFLRERMAWLRAPQSRLPSESPA